jgi:hypothetical protein
LLSLAGCQLFRPDGSEVDLNNPFGVYESVGAISDNQPPGLLSTFTIVDVTSVDQGMA